MAIGWLTILQHVPWSEVLKNAPKVADGAKRLWGSIARKPVVATPEIRLAPSADNPVAQLEARISALEAGLSETHQQLLASTELIKSLSEQNAQLVEGMERTRLAFRWLVVALGAVTILALAAIGFTIAGR